MSFTTPKTVIASGARAWLPVYVRVLTRVYPKIAQWHWLIRRFFCPIHQIKSTEKIGKLVKFNWYWQNQNTNSLSTLSSSLSSSSRFHLPAFSSPDNACDDLCVNTFQPHFLSLYWFLFAQLSLYYLGRLSFPLLLILLDESSCKIGRNEKAIYLPYPRTKQCFTIN